MEKIGIFYGSNTGKTIAIAEEVEFNLRKQDYEMIDVKDGVEKIKEFRNLILLTPTYGVGELQEDWEKHLDELEQIDFTGKKVGLIGLGNQFAFGESFVGGMRILYDLVNQQGGEIIGFTSTEGYKYEESEAVIDDKFVGLAIDENNQDEETPDRVMEWVEEITKEFY